MIGISQKICNITMPPTMIGMYQQCHFESSSRSSLTILSREPRVSD